MMTATTTAAAPRLGSAAAAAPPRASARLCAFAARRRPLSRPLRFKEEEREQQRKREAEEEAQQKKDDALDEARRRRDRASDEARRAIDDAAAAVKNAAKATAPAANKPRGVPPETALVKSVPFFVPAFTRFKEVSVGRVAMLAMATTAALEIVRPGHPGPLQQVVQNTGLPLPTVELALALFVAHGLLGLWPSSPTYSEANARDFLRRVPGPPAVLVNPLRHPARFLGVAPFEWGFTKRNELLHGRLAMLAFLGTCAAELHTGGLGVVGQAAWWLGRAGVDVSVGAGGLMPALPGDGWYSRAAGALLAWSLFCFVLAYARGSTGEADGGDDVY
jgi:hypothetical protein